MSVVLAGIVAALFAALLAIAVGAAGGWHRVRPVADADPLAARPVSEAARTEVPGLDSARWRVRTVAEVLQLVSYHEVSATPANEGKYRVLRPRSVDQAPLDTTSNAAAHLRSTVWGSAGISRFPGAVPVTAVYDQCGQRVRLPGATLATITIR